MRFAKKGFSFIEIMVAIVVFAIGILAILRLVVNNLSTIDKAKTHTIATFLAKEWIDIVYNYRDSNNIKEQPYNCVLNPDLFESPQAQLREDDVCIWYLGEWDYSILQVNFAPEWYSLLRPVDNTWFDNNKLYLTISDDIERYSYEEDGEETNFARYIRFLPIKDGDSTLDTDKIIKVESHVMYQRWSSIWEVILESFIGNY